MLWLARRETRSHQLLCFGAPQLLDPEIDEVLATLRSAWIERVRACTASRRSSASTSVPSMRSRVHSCTAALHLAMVALGIMPGEEVVVPAMTFASTASAVIHAGGKPVLADVARDTMCLTPRAGHRAPHRRAAEQSFPCTSRAAHVTSRGS